MTVSHRNAASPSLTSPSLREEISARALYMRLDAALGRTPNGDMPVILERFALIYPSEPS